MFEYYQEKAAETAVYPFEKGVEYTALGLAGEAGEYANKVKKIMRGDYTVGERRQELSEELGGVLWYLAMCATEIGVPLEDIAERNLEILADRKDRGVIKGDGDDR